MRAMILAAGLGTRLRPITNTIPKALVPVNGVPMLELAVQRLKFYGFHQIIINVHHFADLIRDFLQQHRNFGLDISLSDEQEQLLDTGGGLKKAAWFFEDSQPFLLYNVDILTELNLRDIFEAHCRTHPLATLAVKDRPGSRYLLFNSENLLCGWENRTTGERRMSRSSHEAALSSWAFSGIHVIQPEIFHFFPDKEVFSMTDAYLELAAHHPIIAFRHNDSFWMDMGRREQFIQAEELLCSDIRLRVCPWEVCTRSSL